MNIKKIMVISHSAANGGAERVATILANALASDGHQVTFYAIHSADRDYPLLDNVEYEFCDVGQKGSSIVRQIKRMKKLRKRLLNDKFDVMISFVHLEGLLLLGTRKFKKIYSLRNDPTRFYNSGITKYLRDLLYMDADAVVFQTPDAKNYFNEKVRSHGVIIANPLRAGLPDWNEEHHNKEIITACRITEQKNLPMLLDAFRLFCNERQDYNLVIYGEGALKSSIEEYIGKLKLEDRVSMPGFCNNIHDKMVSSAMFVSSSDYEGISNSMLEALGIGIPVVCTDCPVGGARMFIQSGENGFLVPVGDAEEMAKKMLLLADDVEMQRKFSNNSKRIREELKLENICRKWENLL